MSKKIKLDKRNHKQKLKLFGVAFKDSKDPFSKASHINLKGNSEAIIDGCYGIVEYTDCLLSVNIAGGTLKFIGVDFSVTDYNESNITVSGTIKSIEFC